MELANTAYQAASGTTSFMALDFSDLQVDCVTTVMLKILDGKCKMGNIERQFLSSIYDVTRFRESYLFGNDIHGVIQMARCGRGDMIREEIHELRQEAERAIGKPAMKAFKRMMRDRMTELH